MDALDKVIREAESKPLSTVFPAALGLATRAGDESFSQWLKLESSGYNGDNAAMTDSTVVPPYRTISGEWLDNFGNVFLLTDPSLTIINEDRLRHGIVELESVSQSSKTLLTKPVDTAELIRKHLDVDVSTFRFSSHSVKQVLSNIRTILIEKLEQHKKEFGKSQLPGNEEFTNREKSNQPTKENHLFEAKPGFGGFNINLIEAWKRLRTFRRNNDS